MELHTLGVDGGYTQKDVTEVAKVFTGWTLEEPRKGAGFVFIERRHQPGAKYVLGETIQENGQQEGLALLHSWPPIPGPRTTSPNNWRSASSAIHRRRPWSTA